MNKTELRSRVLDLVRRHNLIPRGETVVIGVSGGADSVCLLHILTNCGKELGMNLHVAHLNHQLRGTESEADAEYVSNLAGSLGIPITADKQDVAHYRAERNCSIEEAARELRYAFLARVAEEVRASRVAVGHTRDDQVETILMHILRGTGITGLRGLAPCSPLAYDSDGTLEKAGALSEMKTRRSKLLLIRPLLDVARDETASYCLEHGLASRLDYSNLSLSFFRNRLRLQLLPLLRQYNPGIDRALLRLADIASEDSALIEQQISLLWDGLARQANDTIYLEREKVSSLPTALQRQLIRAAISGLVGDVRDIEAIHVEAVRSLLDKPVGKRVCLPHGLICRGGYEELMITSVRSVPASRPFVAAAEARQPELPASPFPPLSGELRLRVPGETFFAGWKVAVRIVRERGEEAQSSLVAHFDFLKTGTEFFVRPRQPGDRFQPLGMSSPKKLYEFMIDAKIPRSWRDNIPIVCSPRQIIWVVGWRIDDSVKVTEASQEILRLEFIRSP